MDSHFNHTLRTSDIFDMNKFPLNLWRSMEPVRRFILSSFSPANIFWIVDWPIIISQWAYRWQHKSPQRLPYWIQRQPGCTLTYYFECCEPCIGVSNQSTVTFSTYYHLSSPIPLSAIATSAHHSNPISSFGEPAYIDTLFTTVSQSELCFCKRWGWWRFGQWNLSHFSSI